jgi:hypothetical protein
LSEHPASKQANKQEDVESGNITLRQQREGKKHTCWKDGLKWLLNVEELNEQDDLLAVSCQKHLENFLGQLAGTKSSLPSKCRQRFTSMKNTSTRTDE